MLCIISSQFSTGANFGKKLKAWELFTLWFCMALKSSTVPGTHTQASASLLQSNSVLFLGVLVADNIGQLLES